MKSRSIAKIVSACVVPMAVAIGFAGAGAAQEAVLRLSSEGEPSSLVTTVTVTATAAVQVEPTLAVINASVDASSETAAEAEAEISRKLDTLAAILGEQGVTVTAGHYTVYPRWDFQVEPGPVRNGFEARRQVFVTLEEPGRVGEVIELLLDSGVSEINGISYGLKDESEARRAAIVKALADAAYQAQVAAEALDRWVWTIRSVSITGGVNTYYAGPVAWEGGGRVAPQPVTVEVTVTVEYLLLPHQTAR